MGPGAVTGGAGVKTSAGRAPGGRAYSPSPRGRKGAGGAAPGDSGRHRLSLVSGRRRAPDQERGGGGVWRRTVEWPSAYPATVPGWWVRDLVDSGWDLVVGFSGASVRQFGGLLGAVLGLPGPLFGLLGASWGVVGVSWGLFGASLGPLGASWGLLGAEGSIFQFVVPLLGPSWACLGGLLGRLGRLLDRLGALLGRLGAVLGASWAVLERSWGPLGPSWS
eukprot:8844238-Pyramimonas_sp.AAC.1